LVNIVTEKKFYHKGYDLSTKKPRRTALIRAISAWYTPPI
jgi:hypothetical protein